MSRFPWQRERGALEGELQTAAYEVLFRSLRKKASFLRRFGTWAEVVAFMREGRSDDPRKDKVLRPIFRAHMEDGDPRWRQVLTLIFWPALESIHWQKRGWDPNPEERWHDIYWAFLETLCRIDVRKRPHRLVQKVFNDTVRRLYDEYCRKWRRMDREIPTDPRELDELPGDEDIDMVGIELREAREAEVRRFRRYLDEGRISEGDHLLLVGTRVYGKSLADYAREAGLNYEAAKKRRQRAEAAIAAERPHTYPRPGNEDEARADCRSDEGKA